MNILTVDVEDYFHVSAFEPFIPKESWGSYESRVRGNTLRILELLDDASVKATFFVLGWVAEQDPSLVGEIARQGHEIACHGYWHRRVCEMTPEEFRRDLVRSRQVIEDASGCRVKGYRAPSFSVRRDTFWYLDILFEEGFSFDSSIFPIRHDHYGIPDFDRSPVFLETSAGGRILELPMSTLQWMGWNFPIAGGGFLRLLPVSILQMGIRRLNRVENAPAVVYFHPWEIDPGQPRIGNASFLAKLRHYQNLDTTERKIRILLKNFSFGSVRGWMETRQDGFGDIHR